MPMHVRFEGDIAVLSNFGRAMNDPRYTDAGREVRELIDGGTRKFVMELRGVGEVGPPLLGVLMTVTREIQRGGGEVVLAGVSPSMQRFLEEMRMEEFWDIFRNVREATAYFAKGEGE